MWFGMTYPLEVDATIPGRVDQFSSSTGIIPS
jgi:hypothetical protein